MPIKSTSLPDAPAHGGEEGKGGEPAVPAVSNAAFLKVIFSEVSREATPLLCEKLGSPDQGAWPPVPYDGSDEPLDVSANTYFNCASFRSNNDARWSATESQAEAYHCLVLDDVGTKASFDALPNIEPTYVLETSASNYQVGYRLRTPCSDFEAVKAAQKRIFGSGAGDKGAGGIVRWARLPNGTNGKEKHRMADGAPFGCKLRTWNPDAAYSLDELLEAFACSGRTQEASSETSEQDASAPVHPTISAEVFRPSLPENPVVTALKERDLYKHEVSPGRHEVTCPWVDEHTDGIDTGACFFEPSAARPSGGFKCHHSHGDRRRLGALLENLDLDRRAVHNRPRIRVVEGELQGMVDAAQVVLAATGEFFQSGGVIKRIVRDAKGQVAAVPQNDADLTLALSGAADWERFDQKGESGKWRRCNPSPNCIRLLVQAQSYRFLPELRTIARQPLLGEEGRFIEATGYDSCSQIFCAFDPSKFSRPEPTEGNARAALATLRHLLREFRFASPQDEAAALSAIFTAVLRATLGRAPGFHIKAPAPGSGKSYLADVIARFASPGPAAKTSYPRTEDEATKMILASLIDAPAVLDFDDMSTDWRPFGAINRLLTSPTMTDRLLGTSKMARVSTDVLVLGSGNNTGPTGDLCRRVLVIHLDTGSETPATMRYEGDPLGEVEANREKYVACVLTIVEAYQSAGRPGAPLRAIATYNGLWTEYCRRPLTWLGLDDPASGLFEQLRDDPDTAALGRLLTLWFSQFGDRTMTLRALISDADAGLDEALEELPCSTSGSINKTSLGRYLGKNAGRPVGEFRLHRADCSERRGWKVTRKPATPTDVSTPLPPLPPSGQLLQSRPSPRLKPKLT
ncbi:DNA-primase RepB domain-containing protein [Sphingomonas kaistensis]|uniref:DNA-primase RepB domain-containing protein n=1 Tax=Sphingomonas kaistensis TaxID=298708 RepID=A0ABZ2G004_9SPHN